MQLKTPCTFFAVRRLSRQISQVYDHRLGKVGLKTTQYSLLSHIRALPDASMGELAAAMGMDRSTLTRNLRPLIDAGWAQTRRGTDARSQSVALTDTGRQVLTRARPAWRAAQAELSHLLGADLAQQLHQLAEAAAEQLAGLDGLDEASLP